jgi:hypothetical protein
MVFTENVPHARFFCDHINVQRLVDMIVNPFNKCLNNLLMRHKVTVMHQTLGEYIRQRRLLLAAQALRSTQRPIFDIFFATTSMFNGWSI